jgi:hypothetical protein
MGATAQLGADATATLWPRNLNGALYGSPSLMETSEESVRLCHRQCACRSEKLSFGDWLVPVGCVCASELDVASIIAVQGGC